MHKLGNIIKLEYGKPLSDHNRRTGGLYPAYGANGEKARTDKFYCDNKSIVIGRKGSAGELTLTEERFWPLDVTYFVRFDEQEYDLRFLYFLLDTLNLPSLAKGVKPGLNRNDVYRIPVAVPSLPEQRRIAGVLDKAFENIAIVKASIEKNIVNARELFQSEAKAIFSQQGSDCVRSSLDQLSTNLDSKRIPITKGNRIGGEFPYYGASGIVDYVSEYIFDETALLVSEDGANLLARSSPIAFSVSGKYWVNNHAHILRFSSQITQTFVEFYLESIKLDDFVTGAAQPKLTQAALNRIPIPIPPTVDAQRRIVERLQSLSSSCNSLASVFGVKLRTIEDLKQSLLQAAFKDEL